MSRNGKGLSGEVSQTHKGGVKRCLLLMVTSESSSVTLAITKGCGEWQNAGHYSPEMSFNLGRGNLKNILG